MKTGLLKIQVRIDAYYKITKIIIIILVNPILQEDDIIVFIITFFP